MGEGLVGGIVPIGIWDMGHGTWSYFVGRKEGRNWFNIICIKLYEFEIITW
jgi:hypothetical protein